MGIARQLYSLSKVLAAALYLISAFDCAHAETQIQVVGLYDGKVAVRISGHLRVLAVGQESLEGVMLLKADSREAILRVDGLEHQYRLHEGQWGPIAPSIEPQRLTITRNEKGLYMTEGSINGNVAPMIIDTGASVVALSERFAQQLHIDYRTEGREVPVTTASGKARGWQVSLNSVRVGEFLQHGVEAVVIEGDVSSNVLLGLTFLKGLSLRHEGDVLYLEANTP